MSRGIRTAFLLGVLAAVFGATASSADAGTFTVATCNDAASSATGAWAQVATASATQLEASAVCPTGTPDPYGNLRNGLGVVDVIKVLGAAPDGAYAEWRFTAPSGTSIAAASVTRDIGNRDEWTPYGRIDGVDQAGESCVRGMNQSFCRIQGTRVFSGLNASTIAYGIRCVVAPYCAHGATLRTVWVLILGATVTLDDRQVPTVSALDVSGVGGGGWWNRAGSVSFSAQDNTGVRRRRVVVDGVARVVVDAPGASAGGCGQVGAGVAYSSTRPCADGRGLNGVRAVSVDPCQWGDGSHSVRGAAVDTGGLDAMSTAATVRVDCTAPTVALGPDVAEVFEGDVVEPPEVEAVDPASGVAATTTEVSVDGGPWTDATTPVLAEAGRTYAFRVRAVDVAGNWSAWRTSGTVLGLALPEPPDVPEKVAEVRPGVAVEVEPVLGPAPLDPFEMPDSRPVVPAVSTIARDPRVRIVRVALSTRRRGRIVTVIGVAAADLATTGHVILRTSAKGAARRRIVTITGGRWSARFRLPKRQRPWAISIATRPTGTHAAAAVRWNAPRTSLQPLR